MAATEPANFDESGTIFSCHRPALWMSLLLRLRLRVRSVRTVAPLGHELVEFGPVLGKAQPLQELPKLALLFFQPAQCIGAIVVESAIAA